MRWKIKSGKGDAPLIDSLAMVMMVALSILVVYLFVTKSLETLAAELTIESAEIVAKDMAGFVTISAAAPDAIRIEYHPSKKFTYDLEIDNRLLTVRRLFDGKYTEGPEFFGYTIAVPISVKEPVAVDAKADIKNSQIFVVNKDVSVDGRYVYKIEGD